MKKEEDDENLNYLKHKILGEIDYEIKIYSQSLKNGGIEKTTSLLIKYLSNYKLFDIYIFTEILSDNEYKISYNIKRINFCTHNTNTLKNKLINNNIHIFIYQSYNIKIIKMLKSLDDIKTIFINHSCFLYWIYINNYYVLTNLYNEFKSAKYVISLIPFENDFLFKKWGINSLHINNFMSFDYDKVIPSDLSSQKILMIGRGEDKNKRFDLGIEAMKYIKEKLPDSEMIVISDEKRLGDLNKIVKLLDLENNIKFVGYKSNPEIYFKEASLHIFPSIIEAFPMVLSETKIYGIPNILVGIDYVKNGKEGICVVYDDNPQTIAEIAIKILTDKIYRKKLGKAARKSMKIFNNQNLAKQWAKIIISVYLGYEFYEDLCLKDSHIKDKVAISIIETQVELLKMRVPYFSKITINDLLNITFINNFYNNWKSIKTKLYFSS
jgi:glycosyltransferase involved in cell wall biosynthesis